MESAPGDHFTPMRWRPGVHAARAGRMRRGCGFEGGQGGLSSLLLRTSLLFRARCGPYVAF